MEQINENNNAEETYKRICHMTKTDAQNYIIERRPEFEAHLLTTGDEVSTFRTFLEKNAPGFIEEFVSGPRTQQQTRTSAQDKN